VYGAAPQEWDAFVREHQGSFCHQAAWQGVMENVLQHQTHYLSAYDATGELSGVLPLVHVRSRVFGNYLLSMPFLNYGGALGRAEARTALCGKAMHLAGQLGVDLLELRARDAAPPGMAVAARKVTTVLPLPATSQELWDKHFRSKLRSQIRRAMKEEMDVRMGAGERDSFYDVFARNMRNLGTPVLPRRWFEAIATAFAEQVTFATVYWRGAPVAAGCGFLWNDEFEITWASSLREHAVRSPNMLLYWSMMQECIARGARSFNFGRSTPGASTHRFKQQWGGTDELLPWGVWGRKTAPPNPDSAKYIAARNVWRRLPLGVTKWVGPALARQLP
jgi:FemAB-related protein (PEP-CTERM system-associated)